MSCVLPLLDATSFLVVDGARVERSVEDVLARAVLVTKQELRILGR
jgi:hypothetical protein